MSCNQTQSGGGDPGKTQSPDPSTPDSSSPAKIVDDYPDHLTSFKLHGDQPHPIISTQPGVTFPRHHYHQDQDSFLCCSIINTMFCNPVLGLVAVILSIHARRLLKKGNFIRGNRFSRASFVMNIVTLIVGIMGHIAWIIGVAVYIARNVRTNSTSSYVYSNDYSDDYSNYNNY